MGEWVADLQGRVALILDQLATARKIAGANDISLSEASKPYLDKIQELYVDELPWAQLMDESDLVVQLKGPAVNRPAPILSAVSGAFDDIRDQVMRVTKAIIGLAPDDAHKSGDLELALSGIARGSLVVGVRVMRPSEAQKGDNVSIFGDDDPLYRSVREAVRQIAVVTQHVSEEGIDDSVRDEIPDPAVRDALTVAAQRLAPSGKRGIVEVMLYSPDAHGSARPLTPRVRRALSVSLRRPIKAQQRRKVEGVVREIDLDARRFELRRVRGDSAVRCVYPPDFDGPALKWLNRKLKVAGRVELGPNGEPRLLLVEEAKLTRERKAKQAPLPLVRRK